MLPYSGFPALPDKIEDMHKQLVALGLNDVEALTARIKKCEDWVDNVEETELTGNPVIFDNALAVPAKSLTTSIEPIQDLHGYDHPWAGGAYKNKLPLTLSEIKSANTTGTWSGNVYSIAGMQYTVLVDSADNVLGVKLYGTPSGNSSFALMTPNTHKIAAGSYKFSGCSGGSNTTYYLQAFGNVDYTSGSGIFNANGEQSVNFTAENTIVSCGIYARNDAGAIDTTIYPMLRDASESTAFAPYSNICPISGRTEARVDDVGKNQLPLTVAGIKAASTTGTWTGNKYAINGVEYELITNDDGGITDIKATGTASANAPLVLARNVSLTSGDYILNGCPANGSNSTYRQYATGITANDTGSGTLFTIASETPTFAIMIASGYAIPSGGLTFKPMIRKSDVSDATFEPYQKHTATIQLGTTVYGAEVDFDTGVATVTDGYIASYDDETLPSTWISDRDAYAEGTTPTTGAEVVYKLATPTTLQLTATQLQMLKGYNRVSSDDADSITIKAYIGGPWEAVTRATKKVTNKTKTTKKRRK